ncbi:MAG: SpoIIE family protein phosphatase [Acidobacteriota bacterium]|nr:SpoIIE family protein phosphatase [Acidobacteriota bacterium]
MSGQRERSGVENMEILLVEDDAGDALLVEELLDGAGSGLEPVWTTTVAEAERRITARTLCILLDLNLPDSEGIEGLRRALRVAGRIPVIVLTGRVDRTLGELAVAEGAQDYLVKGTVSGEELVRAVRYAVERRKGQETARRLAEAELLAAEKARLERGLLPRPIISNPALSWSTRYRPGGGRALLGGDFFDGIELGDGCIRVLMGDVTGHGPDEAALGVALRVAWRSLVLAGAPPEAVLSGLQKVLGAERHSEDVFATVCDITLTADLSRAVVRLGGHPAPLLLRSGRVDADTVIRRGPLLGLVDDATWPATTVALGDDWGLMLFTDGLVEGRTPDGQRLDVAGLMDLTSEAVGRGVGLGALADELIASAEQANGGPLLDDVALFLLGSGSRW